ncbi:MAG: sulfatase-like hydrolase/transferase, partial [Verrucomicrobiota bacterium]
MNIAHSFVICALAAIPLIPLSRAATAVPATARAEKPNIIFILADDVGWGEVSCFGADRFKTPQVDALAKSGMRFESCYSMPMCGPSRCALLTGRYPFRTGLISNHSENAIQPGKEIMMSTLLKKAGYITASAGKWGQLSHGPAEWGFDESLAAGQASGQYWKGKYIVNGKSQQLAEGKYLPDLTHDFIVDFINRHKDQSFFIYYPMIHIHIPILPTPDSKPGANDNQLYIDNIAYMDKLVGKLVAELDRLKLREKTLIVFAGDNGSIRPPAYTPVNGKLLSGHKASMGDCGSHVPMIANWPGTTPAGTVNRDLTDFTDFFCTFAELGGASLPDGVTLDGHSIAAQIKGQKGSPRDWVYVELMGKSFVRDSRWKLQNDGEFFDVKDTPFKEIPVARDTTDAAALTAMKKLQAVLDEHKAVPWDGLVFIED